MRYYYYIKVWTPYEGEDETCYYITNITHLKERETAMQRYAANMMQLNAENHYTKHSETTSYQNYLNNCGYIVNAISEKDYMEETFGY